MQPMDAAGNVMNEGGDFGTWATDADGLPCFDLNPENEIGSGAVMPDGGYRRLWHQVGNDSITATAHAGGWTTLYSFEGGPVRLNGSYAWDGLDLGGVWAVRERFGDALFSTPASSDGLRARWGMGYAQWRVESDAYDLRRRVWAPFGEVPALVVDVDIDAGRGSPRPGLEYVEQWGFKPHPLVPGFLMSRWVPPPAGYPLLRKLAWGAAFAAGSVSRTLTEILRGCLGRGMALKSSFERGLGAVVLTSGAAEQEPTTAPPSPIPRLPGSIFLAEISGEDSRVEIEGGPGRRTVRFCVPLDRERRSFRLSFAVGLAPTREVPGLIEDLKGLRPDVTAERWSGVKVFTVPGEPSLNREMHWHSYYLRSAQVYDRQFDCRYVPQGSAYGFIHGLQGSPRDYALSSVALSRIDPQGAKGMLGLMMRMTRDDGSIYYAHAGTGYCTSALVHGFPTDLPLFLLWALSEYLSATGDTGFLDRELPFYGGGDHARGTVRERALLAWNAVRERIGVGPHGMLRVGSGDWSDPISMMVPNPRALRHHGESGFNTAFAAYVLPTAAGMLRREHPAESEEMEVYAGELRKAMEDAYNGRWFLRGFDGRGDPIGDRHLFLDSNAWCLIAGIGSLERRMSLVETIKGLCDDPSPVGAAILNRDHQVRLGLLPPGLDYNGGVWAAVCAFLTWAYSLYDTGLAVRSLKKQLLVTHADAYPHVWYGIWSGPDSYNSYYSQRPGETFVQPATPMTEFPVMNSNAHAGPILGLMKTLEAMKG